MAYGFALYFSPSGGGTPGDEEVFFHDGLLNMRFHAEEVLAANNSGTDYEYPELTGKTIVAFAQHTTSGSSLTGKTYTAEVDYDLGYPRVTAVYPTYAGGSTPSSNFGGVIQVFVVD